MEPLSPSDSKVLIDGLRLRLDLRIVPGRAGADAAAAAVWRIENAAVATLRLGVRVAYRRAAIASGIGALALALGVWFFGPSTSEREGAGRTPAGPAHESARLPERAAPARVAPRSTEPAVTAVSPVASPSGPPPATPAPVGSGSSSVASPPSAPLSPARPAGPRSASGDPAAAPAPAPPSTVAPPRAAHPAAGTASSRAGGAAAPADPPAVASPPAPLAGARPGAEASGDARQLARGRVSLGSARERDMLELFGDPK